MLTRTLRRAAVLAALLALFWAPFAQAQTSSYFTVLASAARTATLQSETFENQTYSGFLFVLEVTAVTATPALTFVFQTQDVASAVWIDLFTAAAAVATVSTSVYTVHHDTADTATDITEAFTMDAPLGRWRVQITHGDADSATYSVGVIAYK